MNKNIKERLEQKNRYATNKLCDRIFHGVDRELGDMWHKLSKDYAWGNVENETDKPCGDDFYEKIVELFSNSENGHCLLCKKKHPR